MGSQRQTRIGSPSRENLTNDLLIYTFYPYNIIVMEFEWDDRKAALNIANHAFSFEEAQAVFLDPEVVIFDTFRPQDGEDRRKAIGMIKGRLFTVVFTRRGDRTRLISARRSNSSEEKSYGYHSPKT
jgi:uncharacterized protein